MPKLKLEPYTTQMKKISILFGLVLLAIVFAAGTRPEYFFFIYQIPGADKTGHFLLMGTFSFLVNTACSGQRISIFSLKVLKGSLMVIGLVTLEELTQLFVITRTFSLLDLGADYFGIFLFGRLAKFFSTSLKKPSAKY
jgi:hypothetical protein